MYYKYYIHLYHQKQTNKYLKTIKKLNKMETLTILATVLFIISVTGFAIGLIKLLIPIIKKALINICALTLILAVLFINLIKDIKRAIKYATIG